MNINMKYYIVTICAIFIALGVGMLVGFNLNYDQALSKQQSEVLESFNTEFDSLKDKNKALQAEIDKINKAKNAIMISENLIKTKGFNDAIIEYIDCPHRTF